MESLSILVTSCKAYADVRMVHDILFKKYWADCPYKKYLVVDSIEETDDTSLYDEVIVTKPEYKYKNTFRIIEGLSHIKEKYVLLLQEDVLLYDYVKNEEFECALEQMEKYYIGLYRTGASLLTNHILQEDNELLEFPKGEPYRISFPGGLWRKEYCKEIMKKYDNCADAERLGSEYSNEFAERIVAPRYAIYPFIDAVRKGYWEPQALALMNRNRIDVSMLGRSIIDSKVSLKFAMMGYIFNLNRKMILKIQKVVKIGKKY